MINRNTRQIDYSISKPTLALVKFHPYDLNTGASLKEPLYNQLLQGMQLAIGDGLSDDLHHERTQDGNLRIFIDTRIKGKYKYFLEFKGKEPKGEAVCGRRVYVKGSPYFSNGDDYLDIDHKGRTLHYPDNDFLGGMNEAYRSLIGKRRPSMLKRALVGIKNSFSIKSSF